MIGRKKAEMRKTTGKKNKTKKQKNKNENKK